MSYDSVYPKVKKMNFLWSIGHWDERKVIKIIFIICYYIISTYLCLVSHRNKDEPSITEIHFYFICFLSHEHTKHSFCSCYFISIIGIITFTISNLLILWSWWLQWKRKKWKRMIRNFKCRCVFYIYTNKT